MFRIFIIFITIFLSLQSVFAKNRKAYVPPFAALIVDSANNQVLYHKNSNIKVNPASLTKMMTIYLAFEQIEQGKFSMNSRLKISRRAATRPRTNLGLRQGDTITMKEAILSLIVRSANDSAVVIAEAISGNEQRFAKLMNKRAKQLGMKNTNFTNSSGWHHRKQKTTAIDMAKLALALKRDFGKYYHFFSYTSFFYKNKFYKGYNHVMENLKGAEGMKTGYTSMAGWNLVTTAKQGDTRLVGVIIGGKSWKSRDEYMIKMMNSNFRKVKNKKYKVYTKSTKRR